MKIPPFFITILHGILRLLRALFSPFTAAKLTTQCFQEDFPLRHGLSSKGDRDEVLDLWTHALRFEGSETSIIGFRVFFG